jgi:hypothetical protein
MAKTKTNKKNMGHSRHKFVAGQSDKFVTSGKRLVFVHKDHIAVTGVESDEEFMRRQGVFEKLVAQIKTATPSQNLKAELDEL